jgi:hypothetical protein
MDKYSRPDTTDQSHALSSRSGSPEKRLQELRKQHNCKPELESKEEDHRILEALKNMEEEYPLLKELKTKYEEKFKDTVVKPNDRENLAESLCAAYNNRVSQEPLKGPVIEETVTKKYIQLLFEKDKAKGVREMQERLAKISIR